MRHLGMRAPPHDLLLHPLDIDLDKVAGIEWQTINFYDSNRLPGFVLSQAKASKVVT